MAGAGAALALLSGSPSAALPLEHVPVYRYYMVTRTDAKPHAIHATFHYTSTHDEAFVVEWVLETHQGRQYVFDRGYAFDSPAAYATTGGHATPRCLPATACALGGSNGSLPVHVPFPVMLDYVVVTRDTVMTADLSKSPDKHWKFTELTGDSRVTGQLHVRMPNDGDVTVVTSGSWTLQHIEDIGYPGGRYGSIAMGLSPFAHLAPTATGSARLDGGQKYASDTDTLGDTVRDVSGWAPGPTQWRLHGDLTTLGQGGQGPTLLVYDLPEPKALKAFLRKN